MTLQNSKEHNTRQNNQSRYAECIMLSVIMLSVVAPGLCSGKKLSMLKSFGVNKFSMKR